jgi:2-polyprenyl-6-methoxyphenol hydroxylase-like FAD-dependent oxidoreductase
VTDVLIAEAGLVGSAAAIQLGRIGISAELFERGHFRMQKPCGEGLTPAGVAALERLGLNGEKGARSAPRRSSVLYEARCSLLTFAVWFAFSIVTPSDSRSGK